MPYKVDFNSKRDEGLTGKFLIFLYGLKIKKIQKLVLKLFWKLIGKHHMFHSKSIRTIFEKYHNVSIGKYSHGGCFTPGAMEPGTKIGRYSSIAMSVSVHGRNHPMDTKSTSGLFFNPRLGYVEQDQIPFTQLTIGHDVWIGHNAIILPSCKSIGHGAVIGAGVVVNKDIPPYAIVVGNPCRVVRFRFSKEKIDELLEEKWWDKEISELDIDEFMNPLESE